MDTALFGDEPLKKLEAKVKIPEGSNSLKNQKRFIFS
jgi:hypothetical protein